MKHLVIIALLFLCVSVVMATSYIPRDLDEKVAEADLIVIGTATAVGEKNASQVFDYERELQIDVDEILWPHMTSKVERIVLRFGVIEAWPRDWWNYNQTHGIFFLVNEKRTFDYSSPDDVLVSILPTSNSVSVSTSVAARVSLPTSYVRLTRFNDWMEMLAASNAVRNSIKKQKNTDQ